MVDSPLTPIATTASGSSFILMKSSPPSWNSNEHQWQPPNPTLEILTRLLFLPAALFAKIAGS
jgi:hypothetical protein